MNNQPPNNNNLINFIATTVETMRDRIGTIEDQMATRDGLERLEVVIRGEMEQVHLRLDAIERIN